MANTDTLEIIRPDDWHLHLRDGAALHAVLPDTARRFARAIAMPNLQPPVRTVADAQAYRERILAALPAGLAFEPLMTLYLTEESSPADIRRARQSGFVHAVKYYPAGATTNSQSGVTDLTRCDAVFEAMQEVGLPLLVHGEVTDPTVDVFDREAVFIERVLAPLLRDLPGLRVVFEHATTEEAVDFVSAAGPNVAATITPQHLHINRNAMLVGGIRPHAYCLPVAKREKHRLALRRAATSGSQKFFLGTDTAPHLREAKESACGCAGIFNAPFALESYLTVFDEEGTLDRFEGFASEHGPRFYGLPLNDGTVTLERAPVEVPADIAGVIPFHAGETLGWRLAG